MYCCRSDLFFGFASLFKFQLWRCITVWLTGSCPVCLFMHPIGLFDAFFFVLLTCWCPFRYSIGLFEASFVSCCRGCPFLGCFGLFVVLLTCLFVKTTTHVQTTTAQKIDSAQRYRIANEIAQKNKEKVYISPSNSFISLYFNLQQQNHLTNNPKLPKPDTTPPGAHQRLVLV